MDTLATSNVGGEGVSAQAKIVFMHAIFACVLIPSITLPIASVSILAPLLEMRDLKKMQSRPLWKKKQAG